MDTYGSFEDLEVWKKAREFRQAISLVAAKFPPEEKYMLTSQIKRSSRSISANIAEGHGRYNNKDAMRFTRISRGSLKETLDHMYVAIDEKYISKEEFDSLKISYTHCLKLINGYIKYLESRK